MGVNIFSFLFTLPYIPIGVVLVILRLFIFIHAQLVSLILSPLESLRRFVLRSMCVVLGCIVMADKSKRNNGNIYTPIVTNHTTFFDHLMMCLIEDCFTLNENVICWKSSLFKNGKTHCNLVEENVEVNNKIIHLIPGKLSHDQSNSVSKFDHTMFVSIEKVQPVVIYVKRLLSIHSIVNPSNWFSELLCQLFTFLTIYNIQYLTPISRIDNETDRDFGVRIRSEIVNALNVPDTDYLPSSVFSMLSSPNFTSMESSLTASPASSSSSTSMQSHFNFSDEDGGDSTGVVRYRGLHEPRDRWDSNTKQSIYDHLISQVTSILKDVSVEQARNALIKTGGEVESAIEFIFDLQEPDAVIENRKAELIPASRLNVSASQFPLNTSSRQKSLNERRKILLSHARDVYFSKHNDA